MTLFRALYFDKSSDMPLFSTLNFVKILTFFFQDLLLRLYNFDLLLTERKLAVNFSLLEQVKNALLKVNYLQLKSLFFYS
jgi:hypothetical protein